MTIHELLTRRFATKQFDPSKQVADADLDYVLEACRLSASSYNTQPWQVTVVTNPELRAKIRDAAYGQAQVTEASALLVLSAVRHPGARVAETKALIAAHSPEGAEAFEKMVMGDVNHRPAEAILPWMQRQVYIALGSMLLAAADRGLDSCPMEGFDPAKVTEILGHTDSVATVLLPIGYAMAPGTPKVRVSKEQFVEYRK
jgi:nitroreductase/dihydropteridine reductase